jgi:hypothetical protein
MKRLILLIILANTASILFAQSDFFYSENGKEEHFKVRKDKIVIKTKSKDKDTDDWKLSTIRNSCSTLDSYISYE